MSIANPHALASTITAALDRCKAGSWDELAALVGMATRELEWACLRLVVDHGRWGLSRDIIERRFARVQAYRLPVEVDYGALRRNALAGPSGPPTQVPTNAQPGTPLNATPDEHYGFTPRAVTPTRTIG